MWKWDSVIDDKLAARVKTAPGSAPVLWFAVDEMDGKRLSEKSMQEGLNEREASYLWQKKHWTLVVEKLIAREELSAEDARNIKSFEDLRKHMSGRLEKKKSKILLPAEAVVNISEESEEVLDNMKKVLEEPVKDLDAPEPEPIHRGRVKKVKAVIS